MNVDCEFLSYSSIKTELYHIYIFDFVRDLNTAIFIHPASL